MPRRSLAALAVLTAVLAPVPAQAAPLFGDATASLFPPAPCEGSGCYTSALVIADLDADGRVDVLFANGGGYYEPGQAEPSVVYFGGDGGLSDGSAAFGSPSSRLRQVAVGDVDGDGDLDVYQPSGYGLDLDRLFIQTAPRVFVEQAAERLPAGLKSRAGAAHLGDLDDDGDLDLVVTDWGTSPLTSAGGLHLFLNDGQGYFSRLDGQLPPSLPASEGTTPIDVDLHDVDGDLDLDILVDHRNGQSRLLLNDGAARFTEAPFPPKKGPYAYNTEACDIDGDGDLDVLLDNAAGDLPGGKHRTQILVNDGHGVFTDETAARVDGEPNSDDNIVKCADLDDDGDFDLIVGSLSNPTEKVLRNDGQGHFTLVDGAFPATSDPTLGLDVADLDGDGRLDVVTGQGEGSPRLDRVFVGLPDAPVDSRPPVFRQVEALPATLPAGQPVRLRLAVSDGYTSEVGQHATVVVDYATQDSSGQVTARFVGGDLFRADLGVFPGGTQLTLTPRATDRRGHAASAPPLAVTVTGGGEGGASGSSGQGGEGGVAGQAGEAGQGGGAGEAGAGGEGGESGQGGEGGEAGQAGQGGAGAGGKGGSAGAAGKGGAAGQGGAGGGGQGPTKGEFWPGVNISFGETNGGKENAKYGHDYLYPSAQEFDYYKSKGLTTIRMPLRWKRLQPTDKGALDAAEMERIDKEVALAKERGLRLILDPHDYATRNGHKIGSAEVPNAVFADFWGRVAARYKGEPHVVFGLMNEPFSIGGQQWLGAANAAIAAIRKAGASNLILVPGVSWTGAHSWYSSKNAEVMLGVVDTGNNFAFELHQYFDKDSSGTSETCVSATIGAERLAKVTGWLREHGYRGLLGEFGAARNETCYQALDNALAYMGDNRDVWLGWTYWAGGPWWGDYMFTVEPTEKFTVDRPQMKYLVKHAKP